VSYLNFPDSADFEGNIVASALQSMSATEQYAKSVLCLFVQFRNEALFTDPQMAVLLYTRQAIASGNAFRGD
jgi:hypothetical protein